MNTILVLFLSLLFLFNSCSSNNNIVNSSSSNVEIYTVDQFASFLINVDCDKIKTIYERKLEIKDRIEILQYIGLKKLIQGSNISNDQYQIDTRLLIEFRVDSGLEQFCWSMTGFSLNGLNYKPSYKVDSFLVSKGLIILLEKD